MSTAVLSADSELLTREQAARYLGVRPQTLRASGIARGVITSRSSRSVRLSGIAVRTLTPGWKAGSSAAWSRTKAIKKPVASASKIDARAGVQHA